MNERKPGMNRRPAVYGKSAPGQRPAAHGKPGPNPKPAPMEGLAARRAALKVIRQVTENGTYASLALDAVLKNSGLNSADRRLVSRLVYDTLDRMIWLDYVLAQVMAKPDTDIKLKNILRLGACQILLEDRIPESAATNLCVQLCMENGMPGLKGVCNGILRNLIRKKDELVFPDPEKDPEFAASIRYSVPGWIWRKLREDYGDEAEEILEYRNKDEGWLLRPNLTKTDDAGFEELLNKKVWQKEKNDLPHAWKITGAMDISKDADYVQGYFSIQSGGSMLASLAMDVKRGQQILDCCAAPGGKTCYMAEMMNGTGRIQAWDVHEHRTELIQAQARRLGLENIRPMVRDATKSREEINGTMDGVLLDAPCTGLGFMAQKPDLKLRATEESLKELTELQAKMLDTVSAYVKPGGTLVYSTCSIFKDENERQVEAFLQRHPEFEEVELPKPIPEKFRAKRERGLQLLEYRDGLEGFYLIRMKKKYD